MPKNSAKKFKYDEEALSNAIKKVRKDELSIRAASKKYGVPRTTLQDKINGKTVEGPGRLGPQTILNTREEKELVQWLTNLTKCGFPRKQDDLLNTVQKIIRDDKRSNPFTNDRPGRSWYKLFMRRHPELCIRESEGISTGRAVVTEESIRKWFRELETYMESQSASDVLLDPRRIFNCDETSFSMCPKSGKVIAPKGWKNVYTLQRGSEKETITCLFTFSANGDTVTPMVVFPYVRLPKDIIHSVPNSWFLGRSETGWMRSETFFEFIANGFNQWLIDQDIPKPVLLLVDGHKSHLTMELSQFCHENQIILYSFLPNCTHIMQMADVSVFKSLKSDYKKTVKEWQSSSEDLDCTLTKVTFCPLIESVMEQKDLAQSIRNGFRATGIYPFNADAIDYTKCVQNVIENFNQDSLHFNQESLLQKPSIDDILTTANVINCMRDSLIGHGFNVDLLLQLIEIEKKCPATKAIASNEVVLILADNVQQEIEVSESHSTQSLENEADDFLLLLSDSNDSGIVRFDNEYDTSSPTDLANDTTTLNMDIEDVIMTSAPENSCDSLEMDITNYSNTTESTMDVADATLKLSETTVSTHSFDQFSQPQSSEFPTSSSNDKPTSKDFKKHLFYPKPIGSGKKRKEKVQFPMAVSAPEWREMKQNIEDEKRQKAEVIEQRKLERILKAKLKSEAVEQRKKERIEKARIKAEATLKRLNAKMNNLNKIV